MGESASVPPPIRGSEDWSVDDLRAWADAVQPVMKDFVEAVGRLVATVGEALRVMVPDMRRALIWHNIVARLPERLADWEEQHCLLERVLKRVPDCVIMRVSAGLTWREGGES